MSEEQKQHTTVSQANSAPSQRSDTAQSTPDAYGLGHTSGQRGAEILAGFRAEKLPSPETKALARWSGRMVSRLLLSIDRGKIPANYVIGRSVCMHHAMQTAVPAQQAETTIVELACGLSPRGFQLAQALPNSQIIEIDLPEVVSQKQDRLRKARSVTIPDNLSWRGADLGVESLAQVLDHSLVDVIGAEGLLTYFDRDVVAQIVRGIYASIKPGGAFVCDLPIRGGDSEIKQVSSMFSKQAGRYKFWVKDEDDARSVLLEAGFSQVQLTRPKQMVQTLNLPEPMIDLAFIATATKAADAL